MLRLLTVSIHSYSFTIRNIKNFLIEINEIHYFTMKFLLICWILSVKTVDFQYNTLSHINHISINQYKTPALKQTIQTVSPLLNALSTTTLQTPYTLLSTSQYLIRASVFVCTYYIKFGIDFHSRRWGGISGVSFVRVSLISF